MKLGIVIPAYNEDENLVELVREIMSLPQHPDIVVVDDSAHDTCARALENLRLTQLKVIHRKLKGGRGSAVIDGIRELLKAASYDAILEMDADFSHPPSQIPQLLAEQKKQGVDLLIASRYLRGSKILNWPLSRRIFSLCANILARFVLGVPVRDYTNGFRLYNRRAAECVDKTCGHLGTGFISLSEILVNLHYRDFLIGETPTIFRNRIRGESAMNFKEIQNAAIGLFKIRLLRKNLEKMSNKDCDV